MNTKKFIDFNDERIKLELYANNFFLMDFWMDFMEKGDSVADFFSKRGYRTVAIYDLKTLGKHLSKQLEKTGINIVYSINKDKIEYQDELFSFDALKKVPCADVIVVTSVLEYESIKNELRQYFKCDIVSLEEVILSI